MLRYLAYCVALASLILNSSFAMENKEFKVHFKNILSSAQGPVYTKAELIGSGVLVTGDAVPYILKSKNEGNSDFGFITGITVKFTLNQNDGTSQWVEKSIPAEGESISVAFPFKDREKLDSVNVNVEGRAFLGGKVVDGKFEPGGSDYKHVVLGSAVHPVKLGYSGWLHGDSLHAYLQQGYLGSRAKEAGDFIYKVAFGIEFKE